MAEGRQQVTDTRCLISPGQGFGPPGNQSAGGWRQVTGLAGCRRRERKPTTRRKKFCGIGRRGEVDIPLGTYLPPSPSHTKKGERLRSYRAVAEWQKGGEKRWFSIRFTVRASNVTAAIDLSHK